MKEYFQESRHPVYGSIIAFAMLLFYEMALVLGSGFSRIQVRNAPEAWARQTLQVFGWGYQEITFIWITLAMLAIPFFLHKKGSLKAKTFQGILLESCGWALATGFVIQLVLANLLLAQGVAGVDFLSRIALFIGAGLFEELFFRVILTSFLLWFFAQLIRSKMVQFALAITLASFLFSLMHYIGSMGEPFQLYSFLFRFLAGFWFTGLYLYRGFGIAALSHAFYDIYVGLLD